MNKIIKKYIYEKLHAPTAFTWPPSSILFLFFIYEFLEKKEFEKISVLAGATLTIIMALSGLTYNRACAWPRGPVQRRCLFAAEQFFDGAVLFTTGCIISTLLIVGMSYISIELLKKSRGIDLIFIMAAPTIFVILSFYKIIYGIQVLKNLRNSSMSPKKFIRKIKN